MRWRLVLRENYMSENSVSFIHLNSSSFISDYFNVVPVSALRTVNECTFYLSKTIFCFLNKQLQYNNNNNNNNYYYYYYYNYNNNNNNYYYYYYYYNYYYYYYYYYCKNANVLILKYFKYCYEL